MGNDRSDYTSISPITTVTHIIRKARGKHPQLISNGGIPGRARPGPSGGPRIPSQSRSPGRGYAFEAAQTLGLIERATGPADERIEAGGVVSAERGAQADADPNARAPSNWIGVALTTRTRRPAISSTLRAIRTRRLEFRAESLKRDFARPWKTSESWGDLSGRRLESARTSPGKAPPSVGCPTVATPVHTRPGKSWAP